MTEKITALAAAIMLCASASAANFSKANTWLRQQNATNSVARVVTEGKTTPECDSYGTLTLPDGEQWFYTATYEYDNFSISKAIFTLYNCAAEQQGTLEAAFTLAENETGINYVELNPNVTKKFFNFDDKYEFMVYVHATTTDYQGSNYTLVCQPGADKPLRRIDGNQVMALNTAADSYSENYTMIFERSDYTNGEYTCLYDVYRKASYATPNYEAELAHTFEVPYRLVSGSDSFLPILMNAKGQDIYYAMASYEKEYFVPDTPFNEEPVVQDGNNFIIKLYNKNFELVETTVIPMAAKDGYIYSIPMIGNLGYMGDLSIGADGKPTYVVAWANYVNSSDSFVTDYAVYNSNGEVVRTLFNDAYDRLYLTDLPGTEPQICFLKLIDDEFEYHFVDLNSGIEQAMIPSAFADNNLSTSLDRVAVDGSYNYVFSLAMGEVNPENAAETLHGIVWFDAQGDYLRTDNINMGEKIYLVNPYIESHALDPYFFTTSGEQAYMALVKVGTGSGSTTTEELRVVTVGGRMLLKFGERLVDGKRQHLSMINVLNSATNPTLLISYVDDDWRCTTEVVALPLEKFSGGEGTLQNPYRIATFGDLMQIRYNTGAHFVVVNDIDATGHTFPSIQEAFTGSIDGQGHTISFLTVEGSGIFDDFSEGASVKNLVFDAPTMVLNGYQAGFIASYAIGAPTLANIQVAGLNVSDSSFDGTFGGLIGYATTGTAIETCSVTEAEIDLPRAEVGGLAGTMRTSAKAQSSYFHGTINAKTAGGVACSTTSGDEVIVNCHVDATISGKSEIGGIVGNAARGKITNCYFEGSLSATDTADPAVGGIVGLLNEATEDSSATIISNNIVAIESLNFPADAKKTTAHRIVGHSSGDEDGQIDWESDYWTSPNVDWNNPDAWPRFEPQPEKGLAANYAVAGDAIESALAADAASVEGADATLNADLLASTGFSIGTDIESPWQFGEALVLWYETDLISGVEDVTAGNASGAVKFDGTTVSAQDAVLAVYNTSGQLVAHGNSSVSLTGLDNGIYIVAVKSASGTQAIKIAVKR